MSETETTVPMDDKALFAGAISNPEPAAETPSVKEAEAATEQPKGDDRPRDEHGRFAPKVEAEAEEALPAEQPPVQQPVVQAPELKQEPPPGWIPAWRAREIADARVRDLEQKLRQAEKPQEPVDPYLDPEKFRDHGVKQAVDPIRGELATTREYYSRKDAIRTHGQETVANAYKWLAQGMDNGDRRILPVYQRAMASLDPFEEIVTAYKRDLAISTVGDDPNAWFEKELERRKADPEFVKKYLAPGQAQNGAQSIVKLPPSLNRQPGTAGNSNPGTLDDASLYDFATR